MISDPDFSATQREVVLVDNGGFVVGSMPKNLVHSINTPLHLGFSVYVFNDRSQLLMTRRSRIKATWPGVWSNSFCGHPSPGETFYNAIERRAQQELAIDVESITPILTRSRYSCEMPNGVRENEICPVFRALTTEEPRLNLTEVESAMWIDWVTATAQLFISPWARFQIDELCKLGAPEEWPTGNWNSLPATKVTGIDSFRCGGSEFFKI